MKFHIELDLSGEGFNDGKSPDHGWQVANVLMELASKIKSKKDLSRFETTVVGYVNETVGKAWGER